MGNKSGLDTGTGTGANPPSSTVLASCTIPADELPLFSSLWTSDIVSYLDSTMSSFLYTQPQCYIHSCHSITAITPYFFVAQPSVVLLTTAAVVWLATAYEATCAATCCALHSLSNMYIRDDTLECSPAFSLFPTTKFPLHFSTSTRVMI